VTAPRVVIVDSGLRSIGGHNFSYTRAVRRALEAQGATVDVLVNRGCPNELAEADGFHPVFSVGAYDHPLGHGRIRDLLYLRAQSRVFVEELAHGLDCVLKQAPDLVFCHTVADFELLAWRRYLSRARFDGTLALLLRQTPRYGEAAWWRRTLNPYWRLRPQALAALHRRLGRRFVLCTDSAPLSEDYARVYGESILTLPIPVAESLLSAAAAGPGRLTQRYGLDRIPPVRVGYVGDARAAKGFHLLAPLVTQAAGARSGARFVVQCPRPAGGDDHAALPPGLAELQQLASDPASGLTLIPEKLDDGDYGELFDRLQVVLLPYLHDSYREATSGIFAEALALGKPVVVPSGTWMARELGASGGGVVFDRSRPEDLGPRLLEVIQGYDRHAAAAAARAPAWRGFHSPGTLARMLLERASLQPRVH
jgi:glycosyltransferase involved in cell wall biosynthesis